MQNKKATIVSKQGWIASICTSNQQSNWNDVINNPFLLLIFNWAGSNKKAGWKDKQNLWNEQALIRASRLENPRIFPLRACSHNRDTRVVPNKCDGEKFLKLNC